MIPRILFRTICVALALVSIAARNGAALPLSSTTRSPVGDLGGTVTDSASGQPLASAEISVMQGSTVIATVAADAFGRYRVHNLSAGSYQVVVHFIGFAPVTRAVTLGDGDLADRYQAHGAAATSLSAMQATAMAQITVDTRSGDQVFKQDDYHGAPTNTTSQILQQSIAGAARARQRGSQYDVRGQHAEYTYYIDGDAGAPWGSPAA